MPLLFIILIIFLRLSFESIFANLGTGILFLISNDDGVTAPGIRNLVNQMKRLGEVVVVAPDKPQSAMGHAITIGHPLRLNRVDIFDGVEAYKCSGTPADCIKIAKHHVLHEV